MLDPYFGSLDHVIPTTRSQNFSLRCIHKVISHTSDAFSKSRHFEDPKGSRYLWISGSRIDVGLRHPQTHGLNKVQALRTHSWKFFLRNFRIARDIQPKKNVGSWLKIIGFYIFRSPTLKFLHDLHSNHPPTQFWCISENSEFEDPRGFRYLWISGSRHPTKFKHRGDLAQITQSHIWKFCLWIICRSRDIQHETKVGS